LAASADTAGYQRRFGSIEQNIQGVLVWRRRPLSGKGEVLSMQGKRLRLRRLFRCERTVIVPMDHPVYYGPVEGLADPGALVRDVAATDADGLLLTPATLSRVAGEMAQLGAIARIDGTHTRLGSHISEVDVFASVEYALASGADACVLNIYVGADNERDLLRKLGATAEACDRLGLPLVGEMIPIGALAAHYGAAERPNEQQLTDQVALAARGGAELGADVVKTSYTGSVESFRQVIEGASVPVIVAGGPCGDSVADLLDMVDDCIRAGAAGICIGRNVWQRTNRRLVLEALCEIVHKRMPAQEAMKIIEAGGDGT
jgi:DhnA family fructose-bisphosphate aldolase class Ia